MKNKILSFITGKKVAINTKLELQNVVAGEILKGRIVFNNLTDKEILLKKIQISFIACYQRPAYFRIDKEHSLIHKILLRDRLMLTNGETCEMPFEFIVPSYTPISPATAIIKTKVLLPPWQTLHDVDELIVLPHEKAKQLFDALWELGFKHSALSGYVEKHLRQPLQIFSIKPIQEPYLGKLKDLEFFYEITDEYIEVFMIADKMKKELLGTSYANNEQKYSKVKFKIMHYETITPKLIAYYIDEVLKIVR
jgi:sporulation-control protein spo0M